MRTTLLGKPVLAAAALTLLLWWSAGGARADMMLTPAASAQGFQLSTFASGFPGFGGVGPLGIAFPTGGGVLVTDYPGNVRFFPTDTDGQNASRIAPAASYGLSNAVGLAQVGSNIYMTQQGNNAIVQINSNGTYNRYVAGGLYQATGVVTNPANGHLFVSTSINGHDEIFEVNPATGAAKLFLNSTLDGLTITPDGKTLFGAGPDAGKILGYDTSTGKLVYESGPIDGEVDGVALGTGNLAGNLFVNTHAGTLIEINLATGAETLIATGGSRGDFVMPDPNNGSLLLTQSDSVLRLTAPPGGGFGPQANDAPSVPEPSTLALLALGTSALAGWRWRRWARGAAPAGGDG